MSNFSWLLLDAEVVGSHFKTEEFFIEVDHLPILFLLVPRKKLIAMHSIVMLLISNTPTEPTLARVFSRAYPDPF